MVLLDLEDSVPPARKVEARERVRAALPVFEKRGRLLYVRPNDFATGLLEPDLEAVVGPALDGIHLPKTHNPELVQRVDHYLTFLERARGLRPGQVRIIAWIESAEGIAKAEAICAASPRLLGASMGAEDYVTSLGRDAQPRRRRDRVRAGAHGQRGASPRGSCRSTAPSPTTATWPTSSATSRTRASSGIAGSTASIPAQVEIANRVFSPSPEQLSWANRVVTAYERGEREGLGAVGLDGSMVDRPIYVRALQLLQWQSAIDARAPL